MGYPLVPTRNAFSQLIEHADRRAKGVEFLVHVQACLTLHLPDESFGVQELADALFLSRTQLYRKIKLLTGRSVACFIHGVRIEEVKRLLGTTSLGIADIADRTGFNEPSYLRRVFRKETGKTFAQYRQELKIGM